MAYTLEDLQSAVQDDLKDSSFSTTRITRFLNAGLRVIFNTHLFKFCEKAVSGALTSSEYTFEQQSDHQTTLGGSLVDPDDENRYLLLDQDSYLAHRDFFQQYPDPSTQDENLPSYWTEFGDQIYFNCPLDKAYILNQRYYRNPTALSAAADVPDVPETFRELLELYAVHKGEKYRGNHDIAATYLQEFEDGLESMVIRYSPVTQVAPVKMGSSRTWVSLNE